MSNLALFDVTSTGPVSAAAFAWQLDGAFRLTVMVKATLGLEPDADMRVAAPIPTVVDEEPFGRYRTLRHAGDLVPRRPRVDVTLSGHGYVPTHERGSLRLAVYRRANALIDKTLQASPAAGEDHGALGRVPLVYELAIGGPDHPDNPVGVAPAAAAIRSSSSPHAPVGFAPLSRSWPCRRRRLGATTTDNLDKRIPSFPGGFDWAYFQAAPDDQQLDMLAHGDWVVLEGLSRSVPLLRSKLPALAASVVVREPGQPDRKLQLTADALHLEPDDLRATLSWRGEVAIEEVTSLARLTIEAALRQPAAPLPKPAVAAKSSGAAAATAAISRDALADYLGDAAALPFDQAAAPVASRARAVDAGPASSGATTAVSRQALLEALSSPTPFEASAAAPRSRPTGQASLSSGTVSVRREDLAAELEKAAIPFPSQPPPPASRPPAPVPVPGAPWEHRAGAAPVQPQHEMQDHTLSLERPASFKKDRAAAAKLFHDVRKLAPPVKAAAAASPSGSKHQRLSLEACAALAAELGLRRRPRPRCLAEHGLTESQWSTVESGWLGAIARDVRRGKRRRRDAYDDAYVARWEELHGPLTDEQVARLWFEADTGDLDRAQEALSVSSGAWIRLQRVWLRRMAGDERLAARMRALALELATGAEAETEED